MTNPSNTLDLKHRGYGAGHPWYYLLGGEIPHIKAIQARAKAMDYDGYAAADIMTASAKAEPGRTAALNAFKARFRDDLQSDISRYRQCARDLRAWRKLHLRTGHLTRCDDVHVSIILKLAHLINDFAHLHYLGTLETQRDLFDLS